MSTAEAQRLWRARHGARTGVRGRAPSAPCGTLAAHKRHVRNREAPCELCRLAARVDRGFRRRGADWQPSDRDLWRVYRVALDELLADPDRVIGELRALISGEHECTDGLDQRTRNRWDRLLGGPMLHLASVLVGLDDDAKAFRSSTPIDAILVECREVALRQRGAPQRDVAASDTARPTSSWRSSTPPLDWREGAAPTERVVELPFHLYWSDDNNRFDLSKRARVRSMYQTVLTEGSAQDVCHYLSPALLLDVWDELWLSPAVHEAWDGWIEARRRAAV